MTFQVGEKVVYPNHGVGTIENISSRAFGTQSERFYLLRLSPNRMTVMVPFSHVGDVGTPQSHQSQRDQPSFDVFVRRQAVFCPGLERPV